MTHTAVDLIEMKRDGRALPADGIEWLISAYTYGRVPDYQMAAMAMAIVWNGLDADELAVWTRAMLESGDVLDFSDIPSPKIDKHSTGGVGDKISIPLAPMVAVCGVAVPMMSGRGLGHTGGTLDKLEAIPGFEPRLDEGRFREILTKHHLVMAGQSDTMVPADRKLYALRDSTGTVPSIPLIASSIMSKKLSEGLDGLVLDVKTGSGAFMKTRDEARELARTMVGIGAASGVKTVALITAMDQPLGNEVGNANEIAESVAVLRGEGPEDVTELTLALGERMLELAEIDGGRDRLEETIADGSALQKLVEVTRAHGGDPSVLEDTSLLDSAPHTEQLLATDTGYVTRCDALTIGLATTRLGAGRERKEDEIDHGVGVTLHAKLGDRVNAGDPLATVRFGDRSRWEAQRERLAGAWSIGQEGPAAGQLVLEQIDRSEI
ncbi:MAG TPA: thymidine phosphorylase [Acidimicrobiia bacterium]|nr:thymidine phosphorylase [Acidimicrobiia bacterium]